nr:MAG TPA: hypothetical protein [Bacteriophage sp.]
MLFSAGYAFYKIIIIKYVRVRGSYSVDNVLLHTGR